MEVHLSCEVNLNIVGQKTETPEAIKYLDLHATQNSCLRVAQMLALSTHLVCSIDVLQCLANRVSRNYLFGGWVFMF